jgi:DNA-binding winged helix-turn-helix (wHTH) protein
MDSHQAIGDVPLIAQTSSYLAPKIIIAGRYARFGSFSVDFHRQELLRNGSRVKAQGKVFQALAALLAKPGEIVTREDLRLSLWPDGSQVNYEANVNTTLNKLRQLLGDTSNMPLFVETIPRRGYCFIAKVQFVDRLPAAKSPPASEEAALSRFSLAVARFLSLEGDREWFVAGVVALALASAFFAVSMLFSAR